MSFPLLGSPKIQFFDSSGSPLTSGTLAVLDPQDDTNKASYPTSDDANAATNANVNPVVLDSRGEPPNGLFGRSNESYKLVLKDSDGTTIWTVDDVSSHPFYVQTAAEVAASVTPTNFEYEPVNVLRYAAVADGGFTAGGSASGTDNLIAFQAALDVAVESNAPWIIVPRGAYYLSAGFTLPRGVLMKGQGTAHMPIFLAGTATAGTVLLIDGAAAGDCIKFAENTGHAGLRDMSVFNVNTNAIRSVVSVVGHLYPRLKNVEIASLRPTTGSGLFLRPSAAGLLWETLWGDFDNVLVTITDVGAGTEASVRWGLEVQGISSSSRPNANSFRGGQFSGTWGGLLSDGDAAGSGALSCAFHGTKFDTNWDGSFTPQYQAAADAVFGFTKADCYIYPVVQINRGDGFALHGCYFEVAGAPATYDDGANGSNTLLGVVWLDDATEVVGTGIEDCSWASTYLYDKGARTKVDPTTSNHKHSTRLATHVGGRQNAVQAIANNTWTKVETSSILFGDDNELEWDSGNGVVDIRSDGTYLVTGQVEYAGWTTANKFAVCRVGDGTFSFSGSTSLQQGASAVITTHVTVVFNLSRGDTITFETLHNEGNSQNTSGANTFLSVVKIA